MRHGRVKNPLFKSLSALQSPSSRFSIEVSSGQLWKAITGSKHAMCTGTDDFPTLTLQGDLLKPVESSTKYKSMKFLRGSCISDECDIASGVCRGEQGGQMGECVGALVDLIAKVWESDGELSAYRGEWKVGKYA